MKKQHASSEAPRDTFAITSDPARDGWSIASFTCHDGETAFDISAGNCLTRSGVRRFITALETALDLAGRLEVSA